jgi:hypothetical protein
MFDVALEVLPGDERHRRGVPKKYFFVTLAS